MRLYAALISLLLAIIILRSASAVSLVYLLSFISLFLFRSRASTYSFIWFALSFISTAVFITLIVIYALDYNKDISESYYVLGILGVLATKDAGVGLFLLKLFVHLCIAIVCGVNVVKSLGRNKLYFQKGTRLGSVTTALLQGDVGKFSSYLSLSLFFFVSMWSQLLITHNKLQKHLRHIQNMILSLPTQILIIV
jgi:hypothetical protein